MKANRAAGRVLFFTKIMHKARHNKTEMVSKNDVKRNEVSNNGPQCELVSDIIG
jgi:hypothetical protein